MNLVAPITLLLESSAACGQTNHLLSLSEKQPQIDLCQSLCQEHARRQLDGQGSEGHRRDAEVEPLRQVQCGRRWYCGVEEDCCSLRTCLPPKKALITLR